MLGRKREVVLVGCGPLARETAKVLRHSACVVGAFSLDGEAVRPDLGVPHLGNVKFLAPFLNDSSVDEVYLATSLGPTHPLLDPAVSLCERLGMPFAAPAGLFTAAEDDTRDLAEGYLHYQARHEHPVRDAVKRVADVFLAGVQLMLSVPLRRAPR